MCLAWLLKPDRSLWNGFMQMINKGSHSGQSSIIFIPMIDMESSDKSCILSTMQFVANQANSYNVDPVLTFDQPLFWKALEIKNHETYSSSLGKIVLRLGGLHMCMSFLGSIGKLMTSSGLQNILQTVYANHTVPHMLSGKAISRAIRGHLLIYGVRYGVMISELYNCQFSVQDLISDGHALLECHTNSSLKV